MQGVPNLIEPEVFGFDRREIADLSPVPYLIRVLERYFQQYLRILGDDPLALPLSYHDGVQRMVEQTAWHSGMALSEATVNAMLVRCASHSKYPEVLFNEEPAAGLVHPSMGAVDELYRRVESFLNDDLSVRA